ncbi:MAG TPA: hypothetical protein VHM26_03795 [Chitinophagaceae bacterium]|jgi:hypothetical protein|nr:hypothetical protein [Chitinophagaceae bacterium]
MIEKKNSTEDIRNEPVKETGEITEERIETKEEEEYRKAIYALDDLLVFVKGPTKSPRRERREAKQFSEALKKKRAEWKAQEEAQLKKNENKE